MPAPAKVPLATYRVQFTPDFGFEHATTLPGYLQDLGVDTLYASPVWEARSGSRHGYDVIDPGRIREELGGEDAFLRLAAGLRERGLGLLLDLVPNHASAVAENPWWHDVLEHGPASPYARYFDIDWESGPDGRLVLPVLGTQASQAIDAGELSIEAGPMGLAFSYHGSKWPLEVKSYALALDAADGAAGTRRTPTLEALLRDTRYLPGWRVGDSSARPQRRAAALDLKRRWMEVLAGFAPPRTLPLDGAGLARVLDEQPYLLAEWREGLARINYRRFFDIADLAALRAEDPDVFESVHRLPLGLLAQGLATGLRIDHVDGLSDPGAYLDRLSASLTAQNGGGRPYLIVEKILDLDERLPRWPVDGTTGYDFLNALNGVFVDSDGVARIHEHYRRVTGDRRPYAAIAFAAKRTALRELFPSEVGRLTADLATLAGKLPEAAGLTNAQLQEAMLAATAGLPVYRTYMRGPAASADDARHLALAFEAARRSLDGVTPTALRMVERVLAGTESPNEQVDEPARREFLTRWQQLTAAAAAKGVEDTALYTYTPFVSLNEVGGDPSGGHSSVELFHALNASHAKDLPLTMNATSTHDTKRGEDVRARLNVISELAAEWTERVDQWMAMNASSRTATNGGSAPVAADELLFYQSLVGVWPLDGSRIDDVEARVRDFMIKACREAKALTSWIATDEAYEGAVDRFIRDVLHGARSGEFAASFLPFQQRIAFFGAINSLSQIVLKVASPGVPDFYQGSELWDFSLTDPDNRRPVAFDRRALELSRLVEKLPRDRTALCNELLATWRDGRVKLFTTAQSLRTRAAMREAFEKGAYEPVAAEGDRAASVCAFLRSHGPTWVLTVAPRGVAGLDPPGHWPLGEVTWGETDLILPNAAPALWGNSFTGGVVQADLETRRLPVASVLSEFPVAMLRGV